MVSVPPFVPPSGLLPPPANPDNDAISDAIAAATPSAPSSRVLINSSKQNFVFRICSNWSCNPSIILSCIASSAARCNSMLEIVSSSNCVRWVLNKSVKASSEVCLASYTASTAALTDSGSATHVHTPLTSMATLRSFNTFSSSRLARATAKSALLTSYCLSRISYWRWNSSVMWDNSYVLSADTDDNFS